MNIEELAFKNYYELKDIQKVDLLLIIEFLQLDRKQWINQYSKAHNDYVDLQKQNTELKEENKRYKDLGFEHLNNKNNRLEDNWNKLKEWLEEEKIRLARECSNIYEDDLGKTKLVNEDIYNELNNVLDKMQEIEEKNDKRNMETN